MAGVVQSSLTRPLLSPQKREEKDSQVDLKTIGAMRDEIVSHMKPLKAVIDQLCKFLADSIDDSSKPLPDLALTFSVPPTAQEENLQRAFKHLQTKGMDVPTKKVIAELSHKTYLAAFLAAFEQANKKMQLILKLNYLPLCNLVERQTNMTRAQNLDLLCKVLEKQGIHVEKDGNAIFTHLIHNWDRLAMTLEEHCACLAVVKELWGEIEQDVPPLPKGEPLDLDSIIIKV